jgi:hypothetical protein
VEVIRAWDVHSRIIKLGTITHDSLAWVDDRPEGLSYYPIYYSKFTNQAKLLVHYSPAWDEALFGI